MKIKLLIEFMKKSAINLLGLWLGLFSIAAFVGIFVGTLNILSWAMNIVYSLSMPWNIIATMLIFTSITAMACSFEGLNVLNLISAVFRKKANI